MFKSSWHKKETLGSYETLITTCETTVSQPRKPQS